MEHNVVSSFQERLIKFFPFILSTTYIIGFLIISLRLSSKGLYLKDFFTLDYIKAGIIFMFYIIPIVAVIRGFDNSNSKIILKFIGGLLISFFYCIVTQTFLLDSTSEESLILYPWAFLPFIIFVYFAYQFGKKLNFIKIEFLDNFSNLICAILLSIAALFNFSTQIYPHVKFEYGGGSLYEKTLVLKNDANSFEETINVKVYYENDEWIHFRSNDSVISLPKSIISKVISIN